MRDNELTNLVDEYLYLVEVGSGSTRADECELGHLLDRLALAVRHRVDPGEPSVRPEIPPRDRAVLRKIAATRFPAYGPYNRAAALTRDIGRSELRVASALDDATAIADHLHAVAWLWRNQDWETGLWYLHDSYRRDWGEAMRRLQLYVHVRERVREEAEAFDASGLREAPDMDDER